MAAQHRLTISSTVRLDGELLKRESETTYLTAARAAEYLAAVGLEAELPEDEPQPVTLTRGRLPGWQERSQFATKRDRSKYADLT